GGARRAHRAGAAGRAAGEEAGDQPRRRGRGLPTGARRDRGIRCAAAPRAVGSRAARAHGARRAEGRAGRLSRAVLDGPHERFQGVIRMADVDVTLAGHVATVHLNRPQSLNAITQEMDDLLFAAWQRINADPEIWAVILSA